MLGAGAAAARPPPSSDRHRRSRKYYEYTDCSFLVDRPLPIFKKPDLLTPILAGTNFFCPNIRDAPIRIVAADSNTDHA